MHAMDHDITEADAYAEATLTRMRTLKVPTTPSNFEIFYAYVCQADPELVRALDVLISNHQPFTRDRLAEIHQFYFTGPVATSGSSSPHWAQLSDQIEETLREAADELGDAADSTQSFRNCLEGLEIEAESADADTAAAARSARQRAAALPRLIDRLIAETRAMAGRARSIGENLTQQRAEIESLQSSLEEMRTAAETDQLTVSAPYAPLA
ncbi:hypothetical protein [Rhodovibrio salinarum]|uniref:Uncharacterized protein n=1 Tax=Rhodovibrio salinarum TaxID=1087 RepID=A0A934QIV6_9PROT|nr:hypothetical protein [Rhodovibrio salinarum]MBK1697806.1 hypothetical protein [Rhodovibrio salinarum]